MSENSERLRKRAGSKGFRRSSRRLSGQTKNTLTKQTTAVVAVSVILGALIAVIDAALKYGIDFLVK